MSNDGVSPLVITEGSVTNEIYWDILHFLPLVVNRRRRRLATTLQDDNAAVQRKCGESLKGKAQIEMP